MPFQHSLNTIAAYNLWNITTGLRTINLSMQKELAEITAFGDDNREFIEGLRTGTISVSGLYSQKGSAEYADVVERAYNFGGRKFGVAFANVGSGPNALVTTALPAAFSEVAPLNDAVMVDGEFQIIEKIRNAYLLHNGRLTIGGSNHYSQWIDLGSEDWDNKYLQVHPWVRPLGTTQIYLQETDDPTANPLVTNNKINLTIAPNSGVVTHGTLASNVTLGRYVRLRGSTARTMSVMAFLHVSNN